MLFRPNYLNEEISEKLFQIDPVTFVSTKERVFAIFFSLLVSYFLYLLYPTWQLFWTYKIQPSEIGVKDSPNCCLGNFEDLLTTSSTGPWLYWTLRAREHSRSLALDPRWPSVRIRNDCNIRACIDCRNWKKLVCSTTRRFFVLAIANSVAFLLLPHLDSVIFLWQIVLLVWYYNRSSEQSSIRLFFWSNRKNFVSIHSQYWQ